MLLMPNLATSIAVILRRTHGWLELGCPDEAAAELDGLPDILHCSREVLRLKCEILNAAAKWTELADLSSTAARYFPAEPAFAEQWAWAVHKQGRSSAAYALLVEASEKFEKTWRTNYFLACFAHALERMEEAAQWLGHAFLLHSAPSHLKEQAEEQFRS
jgi:thioredoxin-like negative regulator of GroEL